MHWAAAQQALRSPAFAPLAPAIARLDPIRWPEHDDLGALAAGIATANGLALRFVPPRDGRDPQRLHYERQVAERGEVETRPENWHDLFNALAWIAYPRAKAAINAQHAAMLAEGGDAEARRRSSPRDALTLFDEGGLVIAATTAEPWELVVAHRWKDLFWHRREKLGASTRFFAFGHALFEKMLAPFRGIVAKTVFVPVADGFLQLPPALQVADVDARLAEHFAARARFASPKVMPPLPVLGIPGWYPASEAESFYDDPVHFR